MVTSTVSETEGTRTRVSTPRHILMCRPTHFEVTYAINPWMNPLVPVDQDLAIAQWEAIQATYETLGHRVDVIEPITGLPDMVFAANGGIVHGGRALASNFTHPERQPEGAAYREWFESAGLSPAVQSTQQNEGEGDVLTVGNIMLAGTGFRTSREAHREINEFFDISVITLELVDPRFYHLDTALAVLDDTSIAYFPGAFDGASNLVLEQLFPTAIKASEVDAEAFGLNAMSDGRNVVLSDRAIGLHDQLRANGFNPIGVDTSELLKAGGSAKCCTLEIRA